MHCTERNISFCRCIRQTIFKTIDTYAANIHRTFLLLSLTGWLAGCDCFGFRSYLLKFLDDLLPFSMVRFSFFSLSIFFNTICIRIPFVRNASALHRMACVFLCVVITSSIFCNKQMAIQMVSFHFISLHFIVKKIIFPWWLWCDWFCVLVFTFRRV